PTIPGYEGVGIVEDVGASVSPKLIGKRVLPLRGEGTWQEYVKTSAELAVSIPDFIDDFTAAQLYINPITAWVVCTEILQLRENDDLLVNACGSSIGRVFVQLSKILGFQLIAVTRSNRYTEELIELGASYVINTAGHPPENMVLEFMYRKSATATFDAVGGSSWKDLGSCLWPDVNFITI